MGRKIIPAIKQSGLTLIELLISMTLSVIILGIVTSVFMSANKNFVIQKSLNNNIQTFHKLRALLTDEIHSAGNEICGRSKLRLTNGGNDISFYHAFPIVRVNKIIDKFHLLVNEKIRLEANDEVLISDCHHEEKFIIAGALGRLIVSKSPLKFSYGKQAEIAPLVRSHYFLQKIRGTTALFVQRNSRRRIELAEGIKEMKIDYDVLDSEIKGVLIELTFAELNQKWFIYAALQ